MGLFHLVGDIGGTKTTLAITSAGGSPRDFLVKQTFPSKDFNSLEEMITLFLKGKEENLSRASFGIAGPIINDQVKATNLPWNISEKNMSEVLNLPVSLINDLSATAHAVPFLREDDLITLNNGNPVKNGSLAVIAPGTGLGEAFLVWDGKRYRPFPSEGGHSDFAPVDALQIQLLAYLQRKFNHVSYERLSSGKGLPNIYSFLKDEKVVEEPDWLRQQLEDVSDQTPVISRAALEGKAEIAIKTMELFTKILAAEAGNLALKILSNGGLYLGGGIPPRILPFLKNETFLTAFQNKGRFASFLQDVPIHVIRNPETALIGAACHALEF
ncbi:MAG: glucokinase [Chloroflexi bacterium HGW-Chloroflexi-2]|jgi:glucokinase|nr:MAG: glucokinase [Chloroflexi bacterium HGW-Chloroflexi-2]